MIMKQILRSHILANDSAPVGPRSVHAKVDFNEPDICVSFAAAVRLFVNRRMSVHGVSFVLKELMPLVDLLRRNAPTSQVVH